MKNEMFIVNLGIVRAFMVKFNCFSFKMLTFKANKRTKSDNPCHRKKYANFEHKYKLFIVTMLTNFVPESFVTMKIYVREKFRISLAGDRDFL